ncbi:MAG TPA: c-type cytochrome, partial [Caulobacteraceae bacterium]|nr:c-type cytochrome [Caulobacteraceae bacterium]
MTARRRTAVLAVAIGLLIVAVVGLWLIWPVHPLGFAGGGSVRLADYKGPSPVGVPPELRGADLVTRGAYLAKAADCVVCHTAEGGQPFAGGRAFPTQFGVLYSPNITPDRQTGIGGWSDAEFLRALHRGVAKGGQPLYPAFPYEAYALMADDDVRAIHAYLATVPAVHGSAPADRLAFPFNQRWLMRIWSALYAPAEPFRPHPDRTPEWNRGAYLVEALAHCGDCHTPRNLAQAPDNRRKFGGALTAGWRAYDITPDRTSGVGDWSDAELVGYLKNGHAAGRGSAAGPMAEAVDNSLTDLSAGDVRAIVAYLRSTPPIGGGLPAPRLSLASDFPHETLAGEARRGRQIFEGACASCHGWSGASPITEYATLTGVRSVNDPSATNVAQMVIAGVRRPT